MGQLCFFELVTQVLGELDTNLSALPKAVIVKQFVVFSSRPQVSDTSVARNSISNVSVLPKHFTFTVQTHGQNEWVCMCSLKILLITSVNEPPSGAIAFFS